MAASICSTVGIHLEAGAQVKSEWNPSLHQSGRRSPSDVGATEQASNRIDLDRTRRLANGMIELTI